eukprot:g1152.t1
MEARVEAISVILADNSEHWKPRLAALEELHALAESARATPEKLSREIFAVLRVPMKKQLTDLRSQIVRAACTVTTHLAKVAGHRSREFLSYVMPTLISISAGANKVMAGFALDCTRDVVAAVQVHKILAPICELCETSKNKVVVESAIGCIEVALAKWDTFRRNDVDLIVEAVQRCLGAASPKARETARKAFWGLRRLYPARAERVFKAQDARTQNLITEAEPKVAAEEEEKEEGTDEQESISGDMGSDNGADQRRGDGAKSDVRSNSVARKVSIDTEAPAGAAQRAGSPKRSPGRSRLRHSQSPRSPRSAEDIPYDINDRVLVTDQRLPAFVRFVGMTEFASGMWIGCELIGKHTGKNSGEVKGVKYFECRENKGLFVRNGNLIFDDDPEAIEVLEAESEENSDENKHSMEGDGEDLANEVASDATAPAETNVEEVPQPPSANSVSAMTVPDSSEVGSTTHPTMSGDANGVAVQLLNAHRTHVDSVLECLRGEMEKLAEFEAQGDGSAHCVAEYASCIAESMHKREQMLESMYQRLGALCASLAQAD